MTKRGGDTIKRGDKTPSRGVSASSLEKRSLITLLTDFGTTDYFVGAMKGVILGISPHAQLVDITHDLPAHDIEAAAFTLLSVYSSFPPGAIHLAVVDPGVGSSRPPILIKVHDQFFVGPDNGIFSYVCDSATPEVFEVVNGKYFRPSVSTTFHGRDVFAPVAAALANGVAPDELGTRIADFVHLRSLTPDVTSNRQINGRIIHIDRFGNCVTNLTPHELSPKAIAAGATIRVNGKTIRSFRKFFAEETGSRSKLFGIWGSAGFLEIAARNDSAAKILKAQRGDTVVIPSS